MDQSTLNARTQAIAGVDMDELIEAVRVASIAYGKQRARVEYMEDFRKAKLYSILEERRHEIEAAGMKATEARLESMARASSEYRDFLKKQYDEKVALVTLEADYYALRNRLDAIQEQLKLIRSEMYMTTNS
jgi:hypothetical protein